MQALNPSKGGDREEGYIISELNEEIRIEVIELEVIE
jgi:hypothetical protein